MRLFRICLVLIALLAAASTAKADTINFTVTITQQVGLHTVPVGTVYTGFVHYDGSVDPNFTGYPPTLTSYGFNFPFAPASLSDFKWEFVQRHAIGQPLFVELGYVNFSVPGASFLLTANLFDIIIPTSETANTVGYQEGESGTVSYTYTADTPALVPEPGSLVLVGTGLLGALNLLQRRKASLKGPNDHI